MTAIEKASAMSSSREEISLNPLFKAIIDEDDKAVKDFLENNSKQNPALINEFNKPNKSLCALYTDGRWEHFPTDDILQHVVHGKVEDTVLSASDTTQVSTQAPLHLACIIGNKPTVEVLLEQKDIDLDKRNGSGETPLSLACRCGKLDIAILLMCRGSKITHDMKDDMENTPWDYLVHRGIWPKWSQDPPPEQLRCVTQELVTRLLTEHGYQRLPDDLRNYLFDGASEDTLEGVLDVISDSGMLNHFLKPSHKDQSTALHLAVASGRITVLLHKLDVMEASQSIRLTINGSQETRNIPNTIQDLASFLNLQDEDGWTALHTAAAAADRETVDRLLARKADPSIHAWTPIQSDAGDFALHFTDPSDQHTRKNATAIHTRIKNAIIDQEIDQEAAAKKSDSCVSCECWIWKLGALKVSRISVRTLIETHGVEAKTRSSSEDAMRWCHLPNNNVSDQTHLEALVNVTRGAVTTLAIKMSRSPIKDINQNLCRRTG